MVQGYVILEKTTIYIIFSTLQFKKFKKCNKKINRKKPYKIL